MYWSDWTVQVLLPSNIYKILILNFVAMLGSHGISHATNQPKNNMQNTLKESEWISGNADSSNVFDLFNSNGC